MNWKIIFCSLPKKVIVRKCHDFVLLFWNSDRAPEGLFDIKIDCKFSYIPNSAGRGGYISALASAPGLLRARRLEGPKGKSLQFSPQN